MTRNAGRRPAHRLLARALAVLAALGSGAHATGSQVGAQVGAQAARNVQFANVTSIDGLSQEFVQAVVQDARGHVWFGTQEGLNRYDGHTLVTYRHDRDDPRSISSDFIWALLVDREGVLWVATDRGLNRHEADSDDFTQPFAKFGGAEPVGSPPVRALARDRSGVFWLGTVDDGLIAIDPRTGKVQRWRGQGPRGLRQSAPAFPSGTITSILEDSAQGIWVGIDGGGVARFVRGRGFVHYRHDASEPASLADDHVRSLDQDRQGRVWVGTASGSVCLFDALTQGFQRLPLRVVSAQGVVAGAATAAERPQPGQARVGQVSALLSDRAGTLWMATDAGLCELRPGTPDAICYRRDPTDVTSLVSNNVTALFEDRSGVLWAGTQGGVSRWSRISETFTYYRSATGALANDTVTSVAETRDGGLWVGTYGGGLARIHPGSGEVRHYRNVPGDARSISDDHVMAVHVDGSDNVWIGTRSGGLDRLDWRTNTITHHRHSATDPRSLSGNAVSAIETDASGALWVGVFDGGLNRRLPDGGFERFRHDDRDPHSLPADRVLDLERDAAGRLWVGMERGGLALADTARKRFVRIGRARGDDEDILTAWNLHESSDGALWIATQTQGLIRWTAADRAAGKGRFRIFGRAEGLPSDTVFSALQGTQAELWVATSKGLAALDLRNGKVRNFDQRSGLRGNEFNVGASMRSRSGRLYFGGTDGLVAFDPGNLRRNNVAPPVSLTAVSRDRVLARSMADGRRPRIALGYLDPFVAFDFVGLDFVAPASNRYRYRMDGLDADWVDAKGVRRAVYSRLPPGDYVFHVRAANNDGVWSGDTASIAVHVAPPPWATPQAYAIYASVACVLALMFLRAQRRKAQRAANAKQQLERLVDLRTREVAERVRELEALNVQLREASLTDSLTGLRNRRFLDQTMPGEVARLERRITERARSPGADAGGDSSHRMFLMMIDLDGFKAINDTHGHKAGDEALLQVRDILRECCRQSDEVVRWGGDEFLVVGHISGFEGARTLAERIRYSVAAHRFLVADAQACAMTASIGVVPFPFCADRADFCHWELAAAVADQCAYLAKTHGRNAWVSLNGSAHTRSEDLHDIDAHLAASVRAGRLFLESSIDPERLLAPAQAGARVA